ncbi:MAG: hypothetical protein ACLR23_03280 [Clostridia bacterium]
MVTLANVATKITAEIKRVETKFDGEIEVDRRVLKELREDADSMSIRISNTYTKGETDTEIASQITQATGNIRLEVSETYATKAEVEQIQVGGRNLLANSDIMETRTKDATDTKMYSLQVVDGYDLDTLINEELTVSVYMYSPGERDWSLVESVGMRNRFGIYVYIMWANDAGGTEATSPIRICSVKQLTGSAYTPQSQRRRQRNLHPYDQMCGICLCVCTAGIDQRCNLGAISAEAGAWQQSD